MENAHTIDELWDLQALPLKQKVQLTKDRIREWVNYYGETGVYVSFSGGKDSTVLLHIARELYPEIKAVFSNTRLEYKEIVDFVKTFDNIDIVEPKISFKKVVEKFGFPLISKEVSKHVYGSRRYLKTIQNNNIDLDALDNIDTTEIPTCLKILLGKLEHKKNGVLTGEYSKLINKSKYKFFLNAPFEISHRCCDVIKKEPMTRYQKENNMVQMTAQMASESRLRTQSWLKYGCNSFDNIHPRSNPMAFWTEQDVLLYIYINKIPIASVYGDVVIDKENEGQISLVDLFDNLDELGEFDLMRPFIKTTGCERTGCVLCGFGCSLEKGEGRFQRLKRTHPGWYNAMKNIKNNGINYFEAIDWINENGNGVKIKY